MKDYKCRFLMEYKNFRIRQLKQDINDIDDFILVTESETDRKSRITTLEKQIESIEKYYNACRYGLISVNECMYKISEIGTYHDPDYYMVNDHD